MDTPKTLFDKIWGDHVISQTNKNQYLLYIDRHLVHEVTSPQAFEGLKLNKRKVRKPELTLGVADHNVPTTLRDQGINSIKDKIAKLQVETLEKNLSENKLENYANIAVENYIYKFDNYKLDQAADVVLSLAINTNLYLNDKQPWMLIKEKDKLPLVREIIYNVLESTRIIGLLLLPLLPELSTKINEQLGSIYREEISWKQQLSWGLLVSNSSLPKPTPIINKLEYEQHL